MRGHFRTRFLGAATTGDALRFLPAAAAGPLPPRDEAASPRRLLPAVLPRDGTAAVDERAAALALFLAPPLRAAALGSVARFFAPLLRAAAAA